MQRFDLAAIAPTPWKNGGGTTREIACWPPQGAPDADAFGWRVSVATIAQAGPFSAFAGVDRQIMLLDGDGVHLRGPGVDHRLDARWRPFAFAGDMPLDCALLGGTSTDFNLMLRRGAWRGGVRVARDAVAVGAAPAGLCMVLAGRWRLCGDGAGTHRTMHLATGQGLRWHGPQAGATLEPDDAGPPMQAALALVELEPVI